MKQLLPFIALLFLTACGKEQSQPNVDDTAQVMFQVYDEQGVDHYTVQTSPDARTWTDQKPVTATGASQYSTTFSITGKFYTQVVAVDKDGKRYYSVVKSSQ